MNSFQNHSIHHFITGQSNIYATQIRIKKPANITTKEIKQFIGICFKMSIVHLPTTRHYWGELGIPSIFSTMPINRFEEIKRFLHFNNNENLPNDRTNYKKLFKSVLYLIQLEIYVPQPKKSTLQWISKLYLLSSDHRSNSTTQKNHTSGIIKCLY